MPLKWDQYISEFVFHVNAVWLSYCSNWPARAWNPNTFRCCWILFVEGQGCSAVGFEWWTAFLQCSVLLCIVKHP